MPFTKRQSGFTLFELILLIVVFSIGLAGILVVFNTTVAGSVDPAIRKQSMALAESMMEEVLLMPFAVSAGGGTRATNNDVRDYHGFAMNGITALGGGAVPGLGNYNLSVAVATVSVGGVPAANSLRVTVTVVGPHPQATYVLVGYKTNYN